MSDFAQRLSELLADKGISQRKLADMVGATEASISRYVNGSRSPGAQIAVDIASVLGVSAEYLLGSDDSFYRDPDVMELLEQMHRRPELRVLFSTSRNATTDDVNAAIKTIERLRDNRYDD